MTTAISVYRSNNPVELVKEYGRVIAKAKFFGCSNIEQGEALALMSMSEGLPISEMRRRYHIVNGCDLSMRADYMRAEFRRLGGEYEWKNLGDDGKEAVIRVKYANNDLEVKYTIEDAKREGLVKSKSRWEKDPGSMLRARVSTKAIRIVCSEVLAGFATDEELEASGGVIDVPFEVTPTSTQKQPPVNPLDVVNTQPASPTTTETEAVTVDAEFTVTQQPASEPVFSVALNEPATEQQRQQIFKLMAIAKQQGIDDIAQRIKAKLETCGIEGGILGLTVSEADALAKAIEQKTLEAWADSAIQGHAGATRKNG